MWQQVAAFQEKVTMCLDSFKPETLHIHVRALASVPNQNPIMAASIHSLARLRMIVQQQLRRASMRSDGSIYFAGQQQASVIARCTQYFVWFFEFMDYMNELHTNFKERIFLPLFKFFHDVTFLGSQGRTSTSGSTFSKMSQFSVDSGDTDETDMFGEEGTSVETARRRAHSRTALMLLSKEFADIKTLYDTSEVDNVAQRLSFLKDQIDFMLEEEDEIDPDLYSADSGKLVQHLDMDEGTENLVRLPVDLLVKFRKAVWLSRRWLELYDKRSKDLNDKLHKVLTLEANLTRRLNYLDDNIGNHEKELEKRTEELHRLMQREERSESLSLTLYDVDNHSKVLKQQLETLRKQRDALTAKVVEVTQRGRAHEYRKLKVEFEKNKLQRFLLERKLATLGFQRQVADQDKKLELHMRPSLIRHTNHVQDTCERLEQTLHEEKRERDNIRSALVPIQEDRRSLSHKLSSRRSTNTSSRSSGRLRAGEAKYVRTLHFARPARPGGFALPQATTTPGWISPPQW
nr:hypothetical protein BaRGS_015487 [Batillaria attramentaria]